MAPSNKKKEASKSSSKSSSSSSKEIGFAELCRHSAYDDLWLAIDGIVYDVTPFMDDHPGGGDIMLSAAGKDGTDDFEDVGHSPHARELLKRFKVGTFKGDFSSSTTQQEGNAKNTTTHAQMDTIGGNAILGLVLPVLVIACAIAAYYLGFNDARAA
jgi:cytochrome b involved in lipid metabolism